MILVAGATGMLGGLITSRLLERGERVRALVRPGSSYRALVDAGAEAVMGDLKDRGSLDLALRGVDVVVTTANSAARGGEDNVDTVEVGGNRNLIDAARAASVAQFIFTSALGASESSPVPFMRGKALAERHLRESGIPYTILSPNIFMEVWIPMIVGSAIQAGEPVTLVGQGQRRHSFVSVSDVAAFAIAAVRNPVAINEQILIGGPLAVSWRDIVGTTGRVLGREIPIRSILPGESIPGLPKSIADFAAAFETYDSPLEMRETAERFGIALTPVEAVLGHSFAGDTG